MADTKITALTALTAADPANDVIPIVDVSDTTMAASGTTKKISVNNILGASGTATLASATITGAATAGGNVGFGTTNLTSVAGYNSLKINNATNGAIIDLAQGDAYKGRLVATASDFAFQTAGTIPIIMQVGGNNSYRIDTAGVFSWFDGAGGTRMTLNSTGLGVGVTPSYKLHVTDNTIGLQARLSSTSTSGTSLEFQNTGASGRSWRIGSGFAVVAGNFEIYDTTASANRFSIDLSGNILSNLTATAPTLGVNSQMVFNLTSNTNLRISVRGTDGTTRTANITLA
jgi:hypothetical protein